VAIFARRLGDRAVGCEDLLGHHVDVVARERRRTDVSAASRSWRSALRSPNAHMLMSADRLTDRLRLSPAPAERHETPRRPSVPPGALPPSSIRAPGPFCARPGRPGSRGAVVSPGPCWRTRELLSTSCPPLTRKKPYCRRTRAPVSYRTRRLESVQVGPGAAISRHRLGPQIP
jgi:hypothetical protein